MYDQRLIESKQRSFLKAINLYNHQKKYQLVNRSVSVFVLMLHLIVCVNLLHDLNVPSVTVPFHKIIIIFAIAYIVTDLINGLIHLFMDNNDNYESVFGPFIAYFHMHHKNIKYSHSSAIYVFFYESGFKIWLFYYLLLVLLMQMQIVMNIYINLLMVCFGLLSSFAEVSHYWCHNSRGNPVIQCLQKLRIILPMKHHSRHHLNDNVNYAFLNGMTDPIINVIAKLVCRGYKMHTDLHVKE